MKSKCHCRFLILSAVLRAVQSRETSQGRQIFDHQFNDGINRALLSDPPGLLMRRDQDLVQSQGAASLGEQRLAKAKAMKFLNGSSGTNGTETHVISATTAVNVTVDGLGGNGTPSVTVNERHLPPIDVSPPAPTPLPPVQGPNVTIVATANGPMPRSVTGLLVLYVPKAQVHDFATDPAARQAVKEGIAYASAVTEELVTMDEALALQHANITKNGQNLSSVDYLFELNTIENHEEITVDAIRNMPVSQLEEKIHAALNIAGLANANACVVHQLTAEKIPADQQDPDLTIVPKSSVPHEPAPVVNTVIPAEDNANGLIQLTTGDVSLLRREAFGKL